LLRDVVDEQDTAIDWHIAAVSFQVVTITLPDLKVLFLSHFVGFDWRIKCFTELSNVEFRKGETVGMFMSHAPLVEIYGIPWHSEEFYLEVPHHLSMF
jgi:hypothetical protein